MASPLTLTISQLPTAEQIQNGDYLIIDNGITTQKLDFANFVVGLNNTTFAATISSNSANIAALSASVSTQIATASAAILSGVQPYYYANVTTPVVNFGLTPTITITFPTTVSVHSLIPNNLTINLSANTAYCYSINSVSVINSVPTVSLTMLGTTTTLSGIVYASIFSGVN